MRERNKKQAAGREERQESERSYPSASGAGAQSQPSILFPRLPSKTGYVRAHLPFPTLLHYPKFSNSKNEKTVNQQVRKIHSDPVRIEIPRARSEKIRVQP
ncbi:hypothetical protein WR25_23224 [Diploscapter pachys]|uniref:Uncharacterized protein n=1 Tax=Diploscapter pachys TaxID=2018661 RepID=A0A2A2JJV3_9BILA|nr:hypothetical protein WR25_23224 [Diploscapter pachys]